MNECTNIKEIVGREILDSRGNPTIECEVTLNNGVKGVASVPSGASTGVYEAVELRDNDKKRYGGLGVKKAVGNINDQLSKLLCGKNALNQVDIDRLMIKEDGTDNKQNFGANAMLGVSLAVAHAAANSRGLPLYQYIGGTNAKIMPVPMLNCINGGKHANNLLSIQEFMLMPVSAKTFFKAMEQSTVVFHALAKILKKDGHITSVGDEGGFAPNFDSDEMAIEYLVRAVEEAGFIPGEDFQIALDVAASEMYNAAFAHGQEGKYMFFKTGKLYSTDELIDYYELLMDKFPIRSIEDGLAEEDWDGFAKLTQKLGRRLQLVGDDLYVTNTKRIQEGIKKNAGNAVLIKLNQIGTLTETLDAIEMTKNHNWNAIVSHRSGETSDTTIADIAVATNAGQIKTGAPSRGERVAKYNRLMQIEHQLDESAIYAATLWRKH